MDKPSNTIETAESGSDRASEGRLIPGRSKIGVWLNLLRKTKFRFLFAQTQPLRSPIKVDIVIPCYNYGWCLRNCVESVLRQTGVDVRVLIIDDASTDDSARVAGELAAADPRVECRIHAVNRGHIKTYNEGLDWVSNTYAVFLDADDMLTPGSLRRACDLLEAHPKVGFVYGRALVFCDERSLPPPSTSSSRWTIWRGRKWVKRRCRDSENCIYSPEVVIRRSVLRRVGGFREELPHSADFEMWMRLALQADVGYLEGPDQAWYRDHPMGMHRQQFGTLLAHLTQLWMAYQLLFRDHAQEIPGCQELEEVVRRRLARRAINASNDGAHDLATVAALEEFAVTMYRGAHTLPEIRSLHWKQRPRSGC